MTDVPFAGPTSPIPLAARRSDRMMLRCMMWHKCEVPTVLSIVRFQG